MESNVCWNKIYCIGIILFQFFSKLNTGEILRLEHSDKIKYHKLPDSYSMVEVVSLNKESVQLLDVGISVPLQIGIFEISNID